MRETSALWYDEPKNAVHTALAAVFHVVHDECAWRVDADEYHALKRCVKSELEAADE